MREFLREVNVGLPVTRLAKWKTGFQMTALAMMLFNGFWHWNGIGEFLLWIAGILTFITGYQYFQKSVDYIKSVEASKTIEVKADIKVKKEVKSGEKKAKGPAHSKTKKTAAAKKTTSKKTSVKKTSKKK